MKTIPQHGEIVTLTRNEYAELLAKSGDASIHKKAAHHLFDLLDDIDTASDMAKSNDAAYRKYVEKVQFRRFEVADTDGYTVTFK